MRYVIAGGGAYGTHYLKKIQVALQSGKLALDEVIVVDKNSDCQAKEEMRNISNATLWVGTWNEFSQVVWANKESLKGDIWIPAPLAPHILSDWIIIRLEKELGHKYVQSSSTPRLPKIPFTHITPDGRILLSHAPGKCPLDCIEPKVCAITEDARSWEMRDTLVEMLTSAESPVPANAVAMFFCKHHCDAGQHDVGGISFRTIYEETDKVLNHLLSGNRSFGIATFSSCHGVMNLFESDIQA
jgi:hypothetical protein